MRERKLQNRLLELEKCDLQSASKSKNFFCMTLLLHCDSHALTFSERPNGRNRPSNNKRVRAWLVIKLVNGPNKGLVAVPSKCRAKFDPKHLRLC
jgi:hypothetical protein